MIRIVNAIRAIGAAIDAMPKPVRDFGEALVSAAVTGAELAVVGLDLSDPNLTAKMVVGVGLFGAQQAVLSAARRKLVAAVVPATP